MKLNLKKPRRSQGLSLVETVIIVSVLGIISAIAIPVVSNMRSTARSTKLNTDVRTLNSAVIGYLGSGGNLDGIAEPSDVLERLKISLSTEDGEALVGFSGAVIDARLATKTVDQVSYTPTTVVVWNTNKTRFEITDTITDSAIAEFIMDDTAEVIADSNSGARASAFEYNREEGWVWQYDEAPRTPQLQPTPVATTIPEPQEYVPTGPSISIAENSAVSASVSENIANNAGFESSIAKSEATRVFGGDINAYYIDQSHVAGWNTTASDGLIEIWESGHKGIDAFEGDHFVEFNAAEVSTLYQEVDTTDAKSVRIFFAHAQRSRTTEQLNLYVGRNAPAPKTDVNQVEDLEAQGFELVLQTASNEVGGWTTYADEYLIDDDASTLYFAFQSVGEFSNRSVGNFLDQVSFRAASGLEVTGLQVDLTQGSSISNIIEFGTVTLSGVKPGDELDIDGFLPDSLDYSVFADPDAEEITIEISGDAFRWVYENAFSRIRFTTSSDDTSVRLLTFTANDGFAESPPTTFEINL